jgi:Asp-tRNA(Asn)/Glu-tRNA(Gln) amidotransferase A subunit family amidase
VAGGYFTRGADAQALEAIAKVADALSAKREVEVPEAARARAAAFIITASEGASLHLPDLRTQPENFDPATCSRFLAAALIPATWVNSAQRFRAWFREQMRSVFADIDVLIAPATPGPAIRIGQKTISLNGEVAARPNIGVFTQPISFVGLPVVAVPVATSGTLPIGVQLIGAPFTESKLLRAAWELERAGVAKVHSPVDQVDRSGRYN